MIKYSLDQESAYQEIVEIHPKGVDSIMKIVQKYVIKEETTASEQHTRLELQKYLINELGYIRSKITNPYIRNKDEPVKPQLNDVRSFIASRSIVTISPTQMWISIIAPEHYDSLSNEKRLKAYSSKHLCLTSTINLDMQSVNLIKFLTDLDTLFKKIVDFYMIQCQKKLKLRKLNAQRLKYIIEDTIGPPIAPHDAIGKPYCFDGPTESEIYSLLSNKYPIIIKVNQYRNHPDDGTIRYYELARFIFDFKDFESCREETIKNKLTMWVEFIKAFYQTDLKVGQFRFAQESFYGGIL